MGAFPFGGNRRRLSDHGMARRMVRMAAITAIGAMASRARADAYTWTAAVSATWETSGNWTSTSGATFPHLIDDVAQFNSGTSTPDTVQFSSALTVGTLSINNNTTSSYNLNGGDFGGVLTFQKSSGPAQINANLLLVTPMPNNSRLFADEILGSDLVITQTGDGRLGVGNLTSSLNLVGHTLTASGLVGLTAIISSANGTSSLSPGRIVVTGGDVQLRNPLNSYAGVTAVKGGILSLNVSSGLVDIGLNSDLGVGLPGANGTSAGAVDLNRQSLVLDGGTLQYSIQASASSNRLFTLGATGTLANNGTLSTTIVLNNTNSIGFTGTSSHTLFFGGNGGSAAASTFSPQLTNDSANGLTTQLRKTDAGVWIVNNPANTYTGGTIVSGGTLRIGIDNGVSPLSLMTIVNGSSDATFDLLGHNQVVTGLASGTAGGVASLLNTGTVGSTLSVNLSSGTQTYAGVIGGTTNNAISLVKSGAGTQKLTNASTYTGTTAVNEGTLLVDGTITVGGNVTVTGSSGKTATLGGTGSFALPAGKTVTASGVVSDKGVLAPGGKGIRGTFAVSGGDGVVFGNNSSLQVETGAISSDTDRLQITGVSGSLSLNTSLDTLDITSIAVGTFTIANYTSTRDGTFDTVLLNGITEIGTLVGNVYTAPDMVVTYIDTPGNGSIQVQVLAVPEPTAAVGSALPVIWALARRRRVDPSRARRA